MLTMWEAKFEMTGGRLTSLRAVSNEVRVCSFFFTATLLRA